MSPAPGGQSEVWLEFQVVTLCRGQSPECVIYLQTAATMKTSLLASPFSKSTRLTSLRTALRPRICPKCEQPSPFQRRYAHTPADDPYFQSIVDNPAVPVRSGQKHGPGLIVLSKPPGQSSTPFYYLTPHSTHPSHRIWPRDMAGLQASMENRLDSEI